MTADIRTTPVTSHNGRRFLWLGLSLGMLAIALVLVQFQLGRLFVPWYLPVLTSLGAVLALLSVMQRNTFTRTAVLLLLLAVAGLQWYFLLVMSRLPAYEGPAQAGVAIPSFQTVRADGRPFTDGELKEGTPSAIVFFRGRW